MLYEDDEKREKRKMESSPSKEAVPMNSDPSSEMQMAMTEAV